MKILCGCLIAEIANYNCLDGKINVTDKENVSETITYFSLDFFLLQRFQSRAKTIRAEKNLCLFPNIH